LGRGLVEDGLCSEQLVDDVGYSLGMIDAREIPAGKVRATTSCGSKTGMAGKFSKSPWPLIRRLHEKRFGDPIDEGGDDD
jgi:hypothetical protein